QMRQVSVLDSGEGRSALTDLRSTSWEDGAARSLRFNSESRMNDRTVETVSGTAERSKKAVDVSLTKPRPTSFQLPSTAVFPTEHLRRVIEAAQSGRSLLEVLTYDGSDTGRKVYNTLTVIGWPLSPEMSKLDDASARLPELAGMTRWPVTISYF